MSDARGKAVAVIVLAAKSAFEDDSLPISEIVVSCVAKLNTLDIELNADGEHLLEETLKTAREKMTLQAAEDVGRRTANAILGNRIGN